jgi:hypothetical protein
VEELKNFAEIINAVGSVGILGIIAALFIRGDLLSRKTVDEIIERLLAEISVKLTAAVDDIMERRLKEFKEEITADNRRGRLF